MAGPGHSELSLRAREIFRLVVEGYIASGLPVGSRTIAGTGAVGLSPASIRSVLQELQDAGLLAAPHTSAGRMPTEVGLRLFVDGIMQAAEPSAAERAQIERGLAEGGTIEAALAAAETRRRCASRRPTRAHSRSSTRCMLRSTRRSSCWNATIPNYRPMS